MSTSPRLAAALAALLLAACAGVAPRPELPAANALAATRGTALDRLVEPAEQAHPGQSAFRLVREGTEAFVLRERTARLAGRSLDVQTYIWHADLTGSFLAYRLLEAADRGVQVRVLVDDMDVRRNSYALEGLDAHPNIEVRLFNPFRSRSGKVSFMLEFAGNFGRATRRMHNKSWIADNRVAIVGGRNLGDEYFGASDAINFVDLDFAMIGPVVREVSASFDRYWNSAVAYPVRLLVPEAGQPAAGDTLRARLVPFVAEARQSRYAAGLADDDALGELVTGPIPLEWTSSARFVADDPLKVLGKGGGVAGSQVLALLLPAIEGATGDLAVISPYFVPGRSGTELFVQRAQAGTRVRILTNSLAANDVAAVYGGYAQSRKPLLKGGARLWELKPGSGGEDGRSLFGSSGASLHTKALTIDGVMAFVGSYNIDPRSAALNTEQGVFVESAAIATQLAEIFEAQTSGARAWEVTVKDNRIQWSDGSQTLDKTPEASAWDKLQAWLAGVLPVRSQL
jgi:cardiolipin synthase C